MNNRKNTHTTALACQHCGTPIGTADLHPDAELVGTCGTCRTRHRRGRPPYGWQRDKAGNLILNPAEQAALRTIHELRDANPDASLATLADLLHQHAIQPRRATRWAPRTLASILRREPPATPDPKPQQP